MFLQSLAGFIVLALFAWAVSEDRGQVRPKAVAAGLGIQLALAVLLLKIPVFKELFLPLNSLVLALQEATTAGTSFVFGYLGGGPSPYAASNAPGATTFILAVQALPLVLVMSALSALLFYWKILPLVVRGFSWCLQKSMGIGGALGLGTAANIFVGMIEAPLFIRPYLAKMTRSELFAVMTCGMATIAGTVMVLYASILGDAIPNALGHILIASIISAPAAITVAGIMVPETAEPTSGRIVPARKATSSMDAVTKGTLDGLALLLNIVAMLVVLVALVHLVNQVLGLLPSVAGSDLTLQRILGALMAPVVWLMGVPWSEARSAGSLMGTKTILNEFLAYLEMVQLPPGTLSDRSRLIMTYAMCGFANFGSLGIMIGGLGSMAPERRDEIVALGLRSIAAGTIATCMTGAAVGLLTAF
jgi:CNT family concentrative nucleoside transporter